MEAFSVHGPFFRLLSNAVSRLRNQIPTHCAPSPYTRSVRSEAASKHTPDSERPAQQPRHTSRSRGALSMRPSRPACHHTTYPYLERSSTTSAPPPSLATQPLGHDSAEGRDRSSLARALLEPSPRPSAPTARVGSSTHATRSTGRGKGGRRRSVPLPLPALCVVAAASRQYGRSAHLLSSLGLPRLTTLAKDDISVIDLNMPPHIRDTPSHVRVQRPACASARSAGSEQG